MKRLILIISLAIICSITAMAQNPAANHQTTGRDRTVFVTGNNPVITYNEFSQTLTVNCNIFVTEFWVTITSMETQSFSGFWTTISVDGLTDWNSYRVDYVDNRGTTYWTWFTKLPGFDNFGTKFDLNNFNFRE